MHPVQCFQKGGLTTAGRADQCGNIMFLDVDVDILQCLEVTVPQAQIFRSYDSVQVISPFKFQFIVPSAMPTMQSGKCKVKVSPLATDFNYFQRKYHNFALSILHFAFRALAL